MKLKQTAAAPLLLIAVFALIAVFNFLPSEALGTDTNPYLAAVIIQLVIFAVPSLLFCTLRGNDYTSSLRLRVPKPSCIILMLCAVILMSAGGSVLDYFMSLIAPEIMSESSASAYAGFAMNSGIFDGLYLVMAFAVLPAITEEFLFRGIMLTEYSSLSISCSVVISALMFAMCHFSLARFPSYFFCGIVLAAVTYATRSVVAPMIVHAVYNITVLFFEDYIFHLAEKNNMSGILFIIITAVAAMSAAVFASFEAASLYRGYAMYNADSEYVPKKKKGIFSALTVSIFSPSFLLLVVMFIIMIIIM